MARISDGACGQDDAGLREGVEVVIEEGKEREGAGQRAQEEPLVHQREVLHVAILLFHYLCVCVCVCVCVRARVCVYICCVCMCPCSYMYSINKMILM